jgi:hypothetical protein
MREPFPQIFPAYINPDGKLQEVYPTGTGAKMADYQAGRIVSPEDIADHVVMEFETLAGMKYIILSNLTIPVTLEKTGGVTQNYTYTATLPSGADYPDLVAKMPFPFRAVETVPATAGLLSVKRDGTYELEIAYEVAKDEFCAICGQEKRCVLYWEAEYDCGYEEWGWLNVGDPTMLETTDATIAEGWTAGVDCVRRYYVIVSATGSAVYTDGEDVEHTVACADVPANLENLGITRPSLPTDTPSTAECDCEDQVVGPPPAGSNACLDCRKEYTVTTNCTTSEPWLTGERTFVYTNDNGGHCNWAFSGTYGGVAVQGDLTWDNGVGKWRVYIYNNSTTAMTEYFLNDGTCPNFMTPAPTFSRQYLIAGTVSFTV